MTFNLLPTKWLRRNETQVPVRKEEEHPVYSLQREMNRMFDDFFRAFDMPLLGTLDWPQLSALEAGTISPKVDVHETDKELKIDVEVPGMTEKDIEVSLCRDGIVISGEKKQESEENTKGWYRMERTYGSFRRSIPLPYEIDQDKVEATYKNGVLHIKLPKVRAAESAVKKIAINNSHS
jgi:HSP20 family protein